MVRRSSRMRFAPLEYWRNERVVFGRRKSGPFPVPVIQDVIRYDEGEAGAQRRPKAKRAPSPGRVHVGVNHPVTGQTAEKCKLPLLS